MPDAAKSLITPAEALRLAELGDAHMRAERYAEAAETYVLALRHAQGGRAHLLSRLGLAQAPTSYTPKLFAVMQAVDALGPNVFVGSGIATWQKPPPFFEDRRFRHMAPLHAGLLPVPGWQWNLHTVLWAIQETRDLDGDFVELGVFKGHTTLFCAEYVQFQDWDKTWRLYDTFEGIPADQQDAGWQNINRNIYEETYSFEEVVERFSAYPNIRVIKGRVPEVLDEDAPERIAFMHIDLNNAGAEVAALDRLFDRVVPGGVLIFDDWLWQAARAQHLAERAWFDARGLRVLGLPTGQGLFVKR